MTRTPLGWLLVGAFVLFWPALSMAQAGTDSLQAPEIRLTARLDKTQVPLNRTVRLTITLRWQGPLDRYEVAEIEDPVVRNLKIVGTGSANRVGTENGQPVAIKEYTYDLQPQELGMGYVEGMAVLYTDTVTGKSHRLVTQRLQVEAVDPVPEPGQGPPWVLIGSAVFAVVAGGAAGWYVVRRRRSKPQEPVAPQVSLEEKTLEELRKTVDIRRPDLPLRSAYADLSRLARRYLGEKYKLPGLELTTDELLNSLREKTLDERLISQAEEVLRACDHVKFSGSSGDRAEFERLYGAVELWLTRPAQTQEPAV